MKSYQDIQALIAPKGHIDEYKMMIATLPRHSFREDGKIPRIDALFADGKSQLTSNIKFSIYDDEDTNANPEICFKIEDFIRKCLGKREVKGNFCLEFNLVSDLVSTIGHYYPQEDIEFALGKILNTNFHIKSIDVKNPQSSVTEDLFWLVSGYEMYSEEFEDGEEETYVKANITPVYADILRNSDLDPFERRMMGSFPAISRRWYEVIRLWLSYRSKTRNEISIKYSELCDWMPIDQRNSEAGMRDQIENIHRPLIECGFVKDFNIFEKANRSIKDWAMEYQF